MFAGIYAEQEKCPFEIQVNGQAKELEYDYFKSLMVERNEAANPKGLNYRLVESAGIKVEQLTFRGKMLALTQKRYQPGSGSSVKLLNYTAACIRLRKLDTAINYLQDVTRESSPPYYSLMNFAQIFAYQGDWETAQRWHGLALFDVPFQPELALGTASQLQWQNRVEKKYYNRWLLLNKQKAFKKSELASEEPLALFAESDQEGQFVASDYLQESYRTRLKKQLPPDALAITQQLVLWNPWDTQLLWLLAEIYAVHEKYYEASDLLHQCTWGRSFTNRRWLIEHKHAISKALENQPKQGAAEIETGNDALADATPEEGLLGISSTTWIVIIALFTCLSLLLLTLQVRNLFRRRLTR